MLGIVDINYNVNTLSINFNTQPTTSSQTGFDMLIEVSDISRLTTLKINYMTIDPSFPYTISINHFSYTSLLIGPFDDPVYINFTQSSGTLLDLSHQNAMLAFQNSF